MFFTRKPSRCAAMPVLFLLSGPKMGFSPRMGRHIAPITVKSRMPNFTFIRAEMWGYSPKTGKI